MKISEVINKLQEVQKDWGNVEVMVYDYDAFHEADEYSFYVREGKLYIRGQLWNTRKIQEQRT